MFSSKRSGDVAEFIGLIIIFTVGVGAYYIHDKIEAPTMTANLIIGSGAVITIIGLFHLLVAPIQ